MPRTDDSPGKRGERARGHTEREKPGRGGHTEGEKPDRGERRARAPSGKFLTRENVTETVEESVRKTGITADRVKSVPHVDDAIEEGSVERKQSAGGYIDYDRQEEAGEDEDVDYVAREETREEE